jgi:predicted transcriptional regulator
MGFIQALQLPDSLKSLIERQLTQCRAASEEVYLAEALRRYAEDLEAEDELAAIADEGIADIEAGRSRV